jgi:hypothetical protein
VAFQRVEVSIGKELLVLEASDDDAGGDAEL